MTKEELEKEAEVFSYKLYHSKAWNPGEDMLVKAYLAGAEPREKRIAELEATCNKWFEHLKNREEELLNELNNQNAKYNKQIEDLEQENAELKARVEKQNADILFLKHLSEELEKENAELKGIKDVATLIRANNDTVITLMQLNNKLVSKEQQLTKAKKIIKNLMAMAEMDDREYEEEYKEAEQFLSEVEKCGQ